MNIGERLLSARKSLGLSLDIVSQKTAIAVSSLSEFENARREPSIRQLSVLARFYNRSLSFFLGEEPFQEPQVLWRQCPEEPVARGQERCFLKLCEQYRHLETWCDAIIEPRLPEVAARNHPLHYRDTEELAARVRKELDLGERPAYTLLPSLENKCGIKIFHERFKPTGTAACVNSEEFGMAILLNAGNCPERRAFDLAHELFHLLVWERYRSGSGATCADADEDEEKLANAFASALLLPTEALRTAVNRRLGDADSLSIAVLPEIAREFGVSIDALVWGIHRTYNFSKDRQEETKKIIEAARMLEGGRDRMAEPATAPPKYPERYRSLAIRALVTGEMSVGKFMEYMEVSRRDAMSYLRTEEETLGYIQITAG